MAKRINKNLVGGLAVALAIVTMIVAYVYVAGLKSTDPTRFAEIAEAAAARGDYAHAAQYYQRAAEHSEDPMYLCRAGDMALNAGEPLAALTIWTRAKTQQPTFQPARERILVLQRRIAALQNSPTGWVNLQEEAEGLLALAEDHPVALHALALSLIHAREQQAGNLQRGVEALRRAVELQPRDVTYVADLASYLRSTNDPSGAESLYQSLVEGLDQAGADAARARWLYAGFLAESERYPEAERLYQEAVTMAGDAPDALALAKLAEGSYWLRRWTLAERDVPDGQASDEMLDRAQRLLEESVAADRDAFDSYIQLGRLLAASDRLDDALRICDDRLGRPITRVGIDEIFDRESRYRLALLASEVCLAAAQKVEGASRDEWLKRAEAYVADASTESPNGAMALLQRGRVLIEMGRLREAMPLLTQADNAYADRGIHMWSAKLLLAEVHLILNEPGRARAVLDGVLPAAETEQARNPKCWTLFAQARLQTNDAAGAIQFAERALAIDPGLEQAANTKLNALQQLGRHDEAAAFARRLRGGEAAAVLLESRARSTNGETDAAIALLTDYLQEHPTDAVVLQEAVVLLVTAQRREEAQALVNAALGAQPERGDLKALEITVRPGEAQDKQAAVIELIESDPNALTRALRLAHYHDANGEPARALSSLVAAEAALNEQRESLDDASRFTYDRMIISSQLLVAAKLGDWAAADAAVKSAQRINADGVGGRVFRARYHLLRNEPEQGLALLREALAQQGTNAGTLVLAGNACEMLRQFDDARAYYRQALESNPNFGAAYKGLASVARQLNDLQTFATAVDQCQRLIPHDPWVRQQSEFLRELRDPAAAIQRREAYLAEHPDDLDAVVTLARLCALQKQQEKADQYYDRALTLSPDHQALVVEAAGHYRSTGRSERAEQVIGAYVDAQDTPEEKANAHVVLAASQVTGGAASEALKTLLQAADIAETFEVCFSLADLYFLGQDPHAALPWYDKAVSAGRAGSSNRVAEAEFRRIGCVLHERFNDVARARELVDEFVAAHPDSTNVPYLRSEIFAREGQIQRAIDVWDAYLTDHPDDVLARYRRAELLMQGARWSAAAGDLEWIKSKQPAALNLEPRFDLARVYDALGRPDAALSELESVYAAFPNNDHAARELARVYAGRDRVADAERIATARINRTADVPAAQSGWYTTRSNLRLRLGDRNGGLSDLAQSAALSGYAAGPTLRVLEAYERLDRAAEGLAFFDAHAGEASTTAMIVATHAALLAKAERMDEAVARFRDAMRLAVEDSYSAVTQVGRVAVRVLSAVRLEQEFGNADARTGRTDPIDGRIMASHLEHQGRWQDAVAVLKDLEELTDEPEQRQGLLVQQAVLLQLNDDPSRARECYERALDIDRDDVVALNNYANLLSDGFGEHDKALEYARRATSLYHDPDLRDTLGWIYVKLERYPEAIAQLGVVVRAAPDRALFLAHLGEAYRRSGQFDRARPLLDAALRRARDAGDTATVEQAAAALEKTNAGRRD